jgi:hypothetical protein
LGLLWFLLTGDKDMQILVLAGIVLALMASQSSATEGFTCSINDTNLVFDASSRFSSGNGQPFLDFKAKAEVLGNDVPDDFRTLDLTESLKHHWIEAGDLRLRFYHERDDESDHASLELIVKTTGVGDDPELAGTYKVTIFNTDPDNKDTLIFEGRAVCSAE